MSDQSSVRAVSPKEVKKVPIETIRVGHRAREDMGDLEGLKKSIASNGLINPIAIKEAPDSGYALLAGERRLRACKELGYKEIACNIYPADLSQLDKDLIELCENVDRKDMTYTEQVDLTSRIDTLMKSKLGEKTGGLHQEGGHSMRDTAKMLHKSAATVSQDIQLAQAIEAIPELGECKTKADAMKMFKKLVKEHKRGVIAEKIAMKRADTPEDKRKRALIDSYIIGDFFEQSKGITDGSIDLIEVDPPFGIDLTKQKKGGATERYNEWDVGTYQKKVEGVASECYRIASPNSWILFWFAPEPHFELVYNVLTGVGFKGSRIPAIWTKPSGQCMNPDTYMASSWEPFFYVRKGHPELVRQGRRNIFDFKPVNPQSKIHPTEKPIEMMCDIYSTFVEVGSRIMVPFLGSGNGLLAAHNIGCSAFGWDLSKEYKDAYSIRVDGNNGRAFSSHRSV